MKCLQWCSTSVCKDKSSGKIWVYISSWIMPLTMRNICSQKIYCTVYYLLQFWHIVFWLPSVHFVIFFLLLHCSDGLCISHQQSVYERGNTLGIVSNTFCISIHNNEYLPFCRTAVVCKRDFFIFFFFLENTVWRGQWKFLLLFS